MFSYKVEKCEYGKKTFFCKIPMFASKNAKLDPDFESYSNTTTYNYISADEI
jgi:hypothetical protein